MFKKGMIASVLTHRHPFITIHSLRTVLDIDLSVLTYRNMCDDVVGFSIYHSIPAVSDLVFITLHSCSAYPFYTEFRTSRMPSPLS